MTQNILITAKFLTPKQWDDLCEKHNVRHYWEPQRIGGGVHATAYTFGKKYIIKFASHKGTIWAAKKVMKERTKLVARVHEVLSLGNGKHAIVQDYVKPYRYLNPEMHKVKNFICDNMETIIKWVNEGHTNSYIYKMYDASDDDSINKINLLIKRARYFKKCGFRLNKMQDFNCGNLQIVNKRGDLKILDLGTLNFT